MLQLSHEKEAKLSSTSSLYKLSKLNQDSQPAWNISWVVDLYEVGDVPSPNPLEVNRAHKIDLAPEKFSVINKPYESSTVETQR